MIKLKNNNRSFARLAQYLSRVPRSSTASDAFPIIAEMSGILLEDLRDMKGEEGFSDAEVFLTAALAYLQLVEGLGGEVGSASQMVSMLSRVPQGPAGHERYRDRAAELVAKIHRTSGSKYGFCGVLLAHVNLKFHLVQKSEGSRAALGEILLGAWRTIPTVH